MEISRIKTGLVKQADQIDVRGVVQLACAHLAHGKHDHPRAGIGVLFGHAGQFAAFDLRLQPCRQRGLRRGIGEIRQCTGHVLQRPRACQIGQPRHQRHTPLALTQVVGKLVGGHIACAVNHPLDCCSGIVERLATPVGFLLHQR